MTKQFNIENGVEATTSALKRRQQQEYAHQWQILRNKIDTLLLSTRTLKTDDVRKLTLELDGMEHDERRQFIEEYWGPVCLDACDPLLIQLNALEKRHNP